MKGHTYNSVYVAIAGEIVNRSSVLLRNIVLNGQESVSNPLLHIHANRCTPPKRTSALRPAGCGNPVGIASNRLG